MTRVVLDTNVLIDGARDDHSAAWEIVQDVLDGTLTAFLSRPLQGEYETLLYRTVPDEAYRQRIRRFLDRAQDVRIGSIPRVVEDDPEDDKVLATAVTGGADALITSDAHLLTLDPYRPAPAGVPLRILTPQQFRNIRGEGGNTWSDFARSIGLPI